VTNDCAETDSVYVWSVLDLDSPFAVAGARLGSAAPNEPGASSCLGFRQDQLTDSEVKCHRVVGVCDIV
jgi:hypothetical protein